MKRREIVLKKLNKDIKKAEQEFLRIGTDTGLTQTQNVGQLKEF